MKLGVYVEPNGNLMEIDKWGGCIFLYNGEKRNCVKFLFTRYQLHELRDYLSICIYKGEL